jgi:V/A-type H+/Na+-transporting ATPase subunit E
VHFDAVDTGDIIMPEQLDSLLKKIQDEAVAKADVTSREHITAAEKRSAEIIAEAERRAQGIIAGAEAKAAQFADNGKRSLEQASRDVLIYLRQAIIKYFEALIRENVPELVPVTVVQEILIRVAAAAPSSGQSGEGVRVFVSEKDYKKLADFFLHQFRERVEKGVELHPLRNIKSGFRISLSNKDVVYDLSDEVLVQMLASLVSPVLENCLKEAVDKKR